MSESKGPRPVAWQVGAFGAWSVQGSVHLSDDDLASGVSTVVAPAEAEARAHALIMAAAEARGEQGHTGALNRVAVALAGGVVGVRDLPGEAARTISALMEERDRLRRDCDAAAEACGVAVVGHVPEAWRLLSEARDEAVAERDAAREALAAARHALGVVGNGSPVLAAWSLRHECSALREDLAAAEAARAEAVREAARLRVELSEVREALAGKTQHDAAAELVAPLREELGLYVTTSPADVVRHALLCVRRGVAGPKPTREPMTHTSLTSIEEHGVVVGDRLDMHGRVTLRHVRMVCNGRPYIRCDSGNMLTSGDSVERGVVEALEAVETPDAD